MFKGQDRLFEEQKKIKAVVADQISRRELEYMLNHPLFKNKEFPQYVMEFQRDHPAFRGCPEHFGKIQYKIENK